MRCPFRPTHEIDLEIQLCDHDFDAILCNKQSHHFSFCFCIFIITLHFNHCLAPKRATRVQLERHGAKACTDVEAVANRLQHCVNLAGQEFER